MSYVRKHDFKFFWILQNYSGCDCAGILWDYGAGQLGMKTGSKDQKQKNQKAKTRSKDQKQRPESKDQKAKTEDVDHK